MAEAEPNEMFELCEFQDQVDLLNDAMIIYELNGRKLKPKPTFTRRRAQLAKALFDEQTSPIQFVLPIDINEDLEGCRQILSWLSCEIDRGVLSDPLIEGWLCKLEFVSNRVARISKSVVANSIESEEEDGRNNQLIAEMNEILKTTGKLHQQISNSSFVKIKPKQQPYSRNQDEAEAGPSNREAINGGHVDARGTPVEDVVDALDRLRLDSVAGLNISDILFSNNNGPSRYGNVNRQNGRSNEQPIGADTVPRAQSTNVFEQFQRPKVPIWKWKIKFSGEVGSLSAAEFIQQVNEMIKSRNSSYREAYLSAAEFFEGLALKWFRTQGHCRNWQELMQRLLNDFESVDYSENLLDYIKSRKQGNSERVVVFFAQMEDMFLRLGTRIEEAEKVRIIKKNLRPEFVKALSLVRFGEVFTLKEACKDLEASFKQADKNAVENRNWDHKTVHFANDNHRSSRFDQYQSRSNYNNRNWRQDRTPSDDRRDNNRYSRYENRFNNDRSWRQDRTPSRERRSDYRNRSNSRSPSAYYNGERTTPQYWQSNNNENRSFGRNDFNRNGILNNRSRSPAPFNQQYSNRPNSGDRKASDNRRGNDLSENEERTTRTGLPVSRNASRSPARQ